MIEESNSNYIFTYFLHLSFNKNVAIQKGFYLRDDDKIAYILVLVIFLFYIEKLNLRAVRD